MRRGLCFLGIFMGAVAACSGSSGSVTPDSGSPDDGGSKQGKDAAPGKDGGGGKPDAGRGKDSGGGGDDSAVPTDSGPGPYPAGPYGVTVGSVIADMQWVGYVDDAANVVATTEPYGPYSLDDARKSGKHYAMLNLAESDCPGCQKSAGEIASGGKSVVDAGGVVIECLMTTGFVNQASKSDLDAWIDKYMLPVTTVKDPDGTGTPTFDALGQREQAYIIDLTTMKIIQIVEGDITGVGATSGGKALTVMHMLLGK